MDESHKKYISIIIVAVVLAGGLYAYRYSSWYRGGAKSPEQQQVLETVKGFIIEGEDCPNATLKINEILKTDPANAEVWSWKGVCEFQMNNFIAAKISFEKAISLDSSLIAPRNYLDVITQHLRQNSNPLIPKVLTRDIFENKIGLKLDDAVLHFQNAEGRVVDSKSTNLLAVYVATNPTYTADQTSTYLKKVLKTAGISLGVSNSTKTQKIPETSASGPVIYGADGNKIKISSLQAFAGTKTYYFTVSENNPTTVVISFNETK